MLNLIRSLVTKTQNGQGGVCVEIDRAGDDAFFPQHFIVL